MADSVYPNDFDSDVELPRVDDNITELGSEAINGLRSAIFNIEESLGLNPDGTAASLADRLDVSINSDGTLKASALAVVGLVTLPITNSQVASNAGIEESKLDLDFTTTTLRTLIANLEVFANAINANLLQDIGHMNQHTAHPAAYGRHQTQDVDGYVGKFAAYNLQGIITEIDNVLTDHIDTSKVGAHQGENISVDDTFLNINASNVQTAIEQLDELQDTLLIEHRDNFHSNGIVRAQDVYLDGYNHAGEKVASATLNSATIGSSFVQFSSPPALLATVSREDIIEITSGSQVFKFFIDKVNAVSGQVDFFGKLPVSMSTPTGRVLANTEETNAISNLILTRRQVNVIQMVHPGAAYVLSNRADPRKITASVYNIRIRWQDGETGDLDVKTALETHVSTKPSTWTAENLAYALNQEFLSYTSKRPYPLIAFSYNGEFGIAYDEAIDDAYVEIVAPSSNSASTALGLVEGTVNFGLGPRRVSIDGYQVSNVHQKLVSSGQATGNSIDTFPVGVSVPGSGVDDGDLVHVYGGTDPANKGSFITSSVSASAITFSPSPGFNTENVNFRVWADTFGMLLAPTIPTLYELFADEYNGQEIRLFGATRVEYEQAASSTENLQQVLDIVDVSRGFVASERRVYFDLAANTVTLGQQGSSDTLLADTLGTPVTLPSTANAAGFRFKLYDNNNSDYLEIQVANANYLSFLSSCALDITIYDRVGEDKFLQLGVVLHNTTEFRHLSDRRMFGNVGRADIRDDFSRDYISYPASQLRSNGVIFGMQVLERNDGNIDAYGGEVFVNGSISVISTRDIGIPQDGDATTYNVFIDGGRVRLLRNDHTVGTNGSVIAAPSLSEILASDDKLLLAQVDVNSSNVITAIRDYRRFVNKLDDKLDLVVEENNITNGGFASFRSVSNWITAMDSLGYPIPRVIKVRGIVELDLDGGSVSIPNGVSVVGDTIGTNSSATRPTIKLVGSGSNAFSVGNGVSFENLLFQQDAAADLTSGLFTGTTISNFTLNNCHFEDINGTGGDLGIVRGSTISDCNINGCLFDFGSSNQNTVVVVYSSGSVSNIRAENSKMVVSGGSYIPIVISASSTGDNIQLTNFVTNYDDANDFNTIISVTTLSNVFIDHCNFDMGSGLNAVSAVILCNNLTNAFIDNNIISYTSIQDYNYIVISASSLTNVKFTNNHMSKVKLAISSITGSGLDISNNSGSDLDGELLSCPTISNCNILGNIITKTDVTAPYVLVATSADRVKISNNTFYSSDNSTPPTNYMFELTNVTELDLSNNILHNFGINGFAGALSISTGSLVNCSNNILRNFAGVGTNTFNFDTISKLNVLGNMFNNVYLPVRLDDDDNLIFNLNYCETTSSVAITIEGTCNYHTFNNNTFYSTATTNIGSLFYNVSTMTDMLLSGNTFIHSNTGVSAHKLVHTTNLVNTLAVENIFESIGGGTYSTYPVYLSGTNAICKNNNIRQMIGMRTGSDQLIVVSGTGSVDYMNYGQEYVVDIPLSRATGINISAATDWTNQYSAARNLFQTTNSGVKFTIDFSKIDVPIGATINVVGVAYKNTAASSEISVAFYGNTYNLVAQTTILAPVALPGSSNVFTYDDTTITFTPFVMDEKIYLLEFDSTAVSGTNNIYSVRIHYTL